MCNIPVYDFDGRLKMTSFYFWYSECDHIGQHLYRVGTVLLSKSKEKQDN